MTTSLSERSIDPTIFDTSSPKVHCLVHPGFDVGEHPEFESYIQGYIHRIAKTKHDILLIISNGEVFDNEQKNQFSLIHMIEGITLYLGLHDGGMGDFTQAYTTDGIYNSILTNNGLDESFYKWCQKNIDMSTLLCIADEWRALKKDFYAGNMEGHDSRAKGLNQKEEQARIDLNIPTIALRALNDLGVFQKQRNPTRRNIRNRGRFHRIYQYAMQVLGKERMNEIFVADAEHHKYVSIQPVSHFQTLDGELIPTPIVPMGSDFVSQVFNASESSIYGNAAILRDRLTYELSISRHQKLSDRQPLDVLNELNFPITQKTPFIFLGEYRDRCVTNVLCVMRERLRGVANEDNFFIANDAFTLERPADHVGTDWF